MWYVAVDPIFESVRGYSGGMAVVSVNKRFGYLDNKGKLAVPIIYDRASDFSEGFGAVKYGDSYIFIDKGSKERIELTLDNTNKDQIIVKVLPTHENSDVMISSIGLE